MPAEFNDHNQLPAVCTTQVTPTNYQSAGILTTVTSLAYLAQQVNTTATAGLSFQITTQDNNSPGIYQGNSLGWATTVPAQSAIPNPTPGVIGSGTLAVVTAPLTSNSPINTPSPGLTPVTAQITTQTNTNTTGATGLISVVNAQQILAVKGQVYYSPGGILNKVGTANSNLTSGGGP